MVCVETTWNFAAFDLDIAMCVLWSNRSSPRMWCWQLWIWNWWWCTSGMCTKPSFVQRGAGNGLVLMACENGSWRIVPWRWPQALVGPTICWWHIGILYNIRQGVPFVRWAGCFGCRSRFDIKCEKNEDFNYSGPTTKTARGAKGTDGRIGLTLFVSLRWTWKAAVYSFHLATQLSGEKHACETHKSKGSTFIPVCLKRCSKRSHAP